MNNQMIQLGGPILPIPSKSSHAGATKIAPGEFRKALDQAIGAEQRQLVLSSHAKQRLAQRGIQLSEQDMVRLNKAIDMAAQKGARDSLLMMDNLGMIVNVPNRTVVTAVDLRQMKENIFTNIDSAVIVD